MPSLFPNQVQTFPQMIDASASDGTLIQQYQIAMQAGNLSLAEQILAQIPNNQSKIITADYLNTINDTVVVVEQYFRGRYSPAYIVSEEQPAYQEATDFWFQITE
jgi:hypothetical protein